LDRRLLILGGFAAVLAITVVAVIVGGGGDDEDSSTITDTSTKPTVEVPDEPPPSELVTEDLVTGDGEEAQPGDRVSVQYVGVIYETGEEFDASWDRGEPLPFQIGGGEVIPGWDQGVAGMRVGGRRQLVIPPDLAYGAQGQPPTIGPNATLVFIVDLLSVE
jgi:peptidylprolyl isomerase